MVHHIYVNMVADSDGPSQGVGSLVVVSQGHNRTHTMPQQAQEPANKKRPAEDDTASQPKRNKSENKSEDKSEETWKLKIACCTQFTSIFENPEDYVFVFEVPMSLRYQVAPKKDGNSVMSGDADSEYASEKEECSKLCTYLLYYTNNEGTDPMDYFEKGIDQRVTRDDVKTYAKCSMLQYKDLPPPLCGEHDLTVLFDSSDFY